ncbi:U32 family peptidase C-terminal domain-containing protein [Candidatus Ruminimicrobium bovinum]|uniref:U32 family peptidase C-terminal domain-containing protein n=1 Tax=Candidatus Ruminimicrobium bovinum TaxID=3242779 RepID=UPI0039B8FB08
MNRPELLLPAGTLSKLKTAVLYGADAVYCGTPDLSLRAKSCFPLEQLKEGADYIHNAGRKIYLTLNVFSHNRDVEKLANFINTVKEISPDGLIISDPGIFKFVKEKLPELPIHISTQANVCSWLTVDFWKKMGANLCVLAREVNFTEIQQIRQKCPDIKLEMFVHGAMCISYSGRCLISSFMASRNANRGACAHSCRWKYKFYVEEELRKNEFYQIDEDERGTYLFNSKDLCLMPKLNDILETGIDSLKIEGRTKSEYYVAQTARIYRKAIDDYYKDKKNWNSQKYMNELLTLQNRGYTLGFFDGMPSQTAQDYNDTSSKSNYRNCGFVREVYDDYIIMEIRHKLSVGDKIELLSPYKFEPYSIKLETIQIANSNKIADTVSPGEPNKAIRINIKKQDINLFPKYTVARIKIL